MEIKKIIRVVKVPFKIGFSPFKFVYNRRKKLFKVVSRGNVKIVLVKTYRLGNKIIVTVLLVTNLLGEPRVQNFEAYQQHYILKENSKVELVVMENILRGGSSHKLLAVDQFYMLTKSGRAAKASKPSNSIMKTKKLRGRRLLYLNSNSVKKNPNPNFRMGKPLYVENNHDANVGKSSSSYKKPARLSDNTPKKFGKGPKLNSIAQMGDDGKIKTTFYNKKGEIDASTLENEFSSSPSSNPSSNPTNLAPKLKRDNDDFRVTKSNRNRLVVVEDDDLITTDGQFIHPNRLTVKGQQFVENTKSRRAGPLVQSKWENQEKEFLPAYGLKQMSKKSSHTLEILKKLSRNITEYLDSSPQKQQLVDIAVVETLLAHPDTEIYVTAMGQGREPIIAAINRGLGGYPIANHTATFERRREISKYSVYITNYIPTPNQMDKFDKSQNSVITYDDLMGKSHTNIGPVFGMVSTVSPTEVPTTLGPSISEIDSQDL